MAGKNGNGKRHASDESTPRISKLGQALREISDKALASGTPILSYEQIQNLVHQIRVGEA